MAQAYYKRPYLLAGKLKPFEQMLQQKNFCEKLLKSLLKTNETLRQKYSKPGEFFQRKRNFL